MRRSIRKRLTTTFIILAVGPLLLVGLILIVRTYSVQKQEAIVLQKEVAERLFSHVIGFISTLEDSLHMLLDLQNFQSLSLKQQKQMLSTLQAQQNAFETLLLLDAKGREKVYLSRLRLYQDANIEGIMDLEAFRIPMSKNITYYGPVKFQNTTGEPLMILAIPINNLHNGKSEGVLIADIRLKEIWNLVARIRPGIKGESYIVDIENRVVAHRNPSVVLRETYFDPPNFNGIYRGLNEEKAVIVRKTISFGDQRLHIIVENPVAEAFALAFETIWVIVVALVTLSIFAAWLGVLAVRKIVFPVQNLAEIARQIQAGQLTKQANISTKDEIGELAEAFNSMTRQLTESMINMEKEVSERKRAETALKESEEKYRVLFQTFPLGISITDRDGNVIEVNATAESLLDLPQEMHVQENYSREAWNIIRPDGTPMPVEEFAGVRAKRENRTIKNLEMGYVKPQGDITWLSVTAAPIPLEKYGEAITYVNISKRKRVERELEKYRNHLEHLVKERTLELQIAQDELLKREKLAVLGQLTATVSHELRNPLGVIRTSTYYLQRRIKDRNEKIDKHLLRIDEQVGICDRLVEDLLEYTRGKVSDRIKCDINALVEEALNQMSISREVKVVRKLAMELPLVLMDPDKMRRVMINLIQNAVIAVTERKKTVSEEEKSNSYEPTLHVTTSSNSKAISIEITDNGIGMDKETAEKAFDPLFTTRARGTGLGLAIVKKILEEHGGTVSLESKLSQGTKIKFNLPIKSPKNHNITN